MAIAEVWTTFNDTLEDSYAALDGPVADIEAAFSVTDFDTTVDVPGFGQLPINVARVFQWTHACSEQASTPMPTPSGTPL